MRWDAGVTWHSVRTVEPSALPFDVYEFSEQHLRVADVLVEQPFVEQVLRAATQAAERWTQRALMPQTWQQVLSGFPSSQQIVLERPPLLEVLSVSYVAPDGTVRMLDTSPPAYLVTGSGAFARAEIRPADGNFPSTATRRDAVTVTFRAGYEADTGELALIKQGIALMAGELFKQRTLSVHAVHNTPAALSLPHFWRPVF